VTMATESEATHQQSGPVIVARAGTYYRVARFIMAALILAMAAWFAYDGYVKYPQQNAEAIERGHTPPHSDLDLLIQRLLGWGLPPLGLALIVWTLYNSRGAYRLDGLTLSAPGHPAVPLEQIVRIDKTLWDRKGIAYVDYEAPGGETGRIKLDDFVYQQEPTDAIVKRLEEHLAPPEEAGEEPAGRQV
jgi:hypothetical protein